MKSPAKTLAPKCLGVLVCWTTVFSCGPSVVVGQGQESGAQGGLEVARVSGKLEAVAKDRIKLKSSDGQEIFAIMARRCTVKYSGMADVKFLRPGQLIRFTADFDTQTAKSQAPIKDLVLFRPVRTRKMSKDQLQDQTAGVYPLANDSERPVGAGPIGKVQKFKVVGQVRALQGNNLQLMAGSRPVMVELDADVKIQVVAGDAMFCMPGDAVKVNGLRNPSQPQWVQADSIEIVGSQSLGTANPKQNPRSRSRGTQAKSQTANK